MRDPFTMIGSFGPFQLWHRDRNGVDGACGWFMRASNGDSKVLTAIENHFALEWDRSVTLPGGSGYGDLPMISATSLFDPREAGWPTMSIHAIALNLFSWAAWEHFKCDRKKRDAFMRKNLFDILLFAENPVDSPCHTWQHRYGINPRETREDRIHEAAVMIYGWILRADRPWYRHPRWHVHHWSLTFSAGYLRRRARKARAA